MSLIANVAALFTLQVTKFAEDVRSRLISKLIKGISTALQNLLKYFNGAAISTFTDSTHNTIISCKSSSKLR